MLPSFTTYSHWRDGANVLGSGEEDESVEGDSVTSSDTDGDSVCGSGELVVSGTGLVVPDSVDSWLTDADSVELGLSEDTEEDSDTTGLAEATGTTPL